MDSKRAPKLSIITVNFNNKFGLEKTFDSVFKQSFKHIEYIVIDGGSVDGSKEVIEEAKNQLSYWVSEKDHGIYHAMNKGIAKATGHYLLFLNSGDYLHDSLVLDKVFANDLTEDIVYGDIVWDTNGIKTENRFPDTISFDFFAGHGFLPHQGSFIRKSLFDSIGLYDESNKIISDWIFFLLAICKHNCSYRHIPWFISVCGRDGISCEPGNWDHIVSDRKKAMQTHFPALLRDYENLHPLRDKVSQIHKLSLARIYNKLKKVFR